jgi:heme/copper-type cytochrome/quinol oxidase subunit 4
MLMKIVYQIILTVISLILIWDMFTQKDVKMQIMAAMTLIPFILRIAMIA